MSDLTCNNYSRTRTVLQLLSALLALGMRELTLNLIFKDIFVTLHFLLVLRVLSMDLSKKTILLLKRLVIYRIRLITWIILY